MQYDVIVIGGGHAGCEAATAAARSGARTALVTMIPAQIGAMSCNPAIGGIGKGHLVREIDVFDGLIGQAADRAAIHHRMLNASKGAAVRGPRVQADRARFGTAIRSLISDTAGLTLVEAEAIALRLEAGRVAGIRTADGMTIAAGAVVIASGTFLNGRLHFGLRCEAGGRIGEPASGRLADQLRAHDVPIGRLKTGTPPRLDGRTVDWARLDRQPSDADGWTMSALTPSRMLPQVACAITRTTTATHAIVRAAMVRSPLISGAIKGRGPRYCPSIEDKIVRFGDRDGHQIFLEPEGLDDALVYPNGISTSLPLADQQAMIASIPGLERARIVTPGYAVEYDHVDPRALDHELGLRSLPGLFCAGQINGTTGYEEAAAQGLVAGLNAAALALGREPVRFERHDSYIGVMIDDLVLQGVSEPYRMLTSRAEHRLHLRADNAHRRLGERAIACKAIGPRRRAWIRQTRELYDRLAMGGSIAGDTDLQVAVIADELAHDRLYAPYLAREAEDRRRLDRGADVGLDRIGTFATVPGLSLEMIEKLDAARPATLGDAQRVRGVTPAALSAILVAAQRLAA